MSLGYQLAPLSALGNQVICVYMEDPHSPEDSHLKPKELSL